jgi:hypothetical protein
MFLDIGVGILLSLKAAWLFQKELTPAIIAAGIVFALLPDMDFIFEFLKHGSVGGKVIREHRELLHFPITFIPVAIGVLYSSGMFWGFLFSICILAHFLHDSIGVGWGIKWLWPFSKRSFKFFAKKDGSFSWKDPVVSWSSEELPQVVAIHGDPDWIKHIYLRPTPTSVIELLVFFAALLILYMWMR